MIDRRTTWRQEGRHRDDNLPRDGQRFWLEQAEADRDT
jgi:hypothetical protein